MKFIISLILTAVMSFAAYTAPHKPMHHPPAHRVGPYRQVVRPHIHHDRSYVTTFAAGLAGSVVGNVLSDVFRPSQTIVIQPAPVRTVIQSPVSSPRLVWIEGRYESKVMSNGTIVNTWIPGHWAYLP